MKRNYCVLLLLALSVMGNTRLIAQDATVDICVYGGTSGGVIAAYAAAKMGKSVILIEPSTHLGGMTSGGLGHTDIGNKFAIKGLSLDFYRRIGAHYGKFEKWTFEPHVAKQTLQGYLDRAKITTVYAHHITSASKVNGTIQSIVVEGDGTGSKRTIKAKMFIDCTYEGDLMAAAGVSYIVGREANSEFNETINGVQLMEGHQLPDGIDPYKVPGKPESGLIWGISTDQLQPAGTADHKEQAYNYRICLTDDPANKVDITRPEGYDSSRYELLVRLFAAQPNKRRLGDSYFIWSPMPNRKTDINNRGGFSSDMIGMNYKYPDASHDERKKIVKEHEVYTKGLLYFYGHDSRVPVELKNEMLKWGYPKDEYVENGNWSPQLYVREARRMKGEYIMTQAHCEHKEVVTDGVGLAAYQMDSHNCARIVVDGMVKNEGNVEVGGGSPYPISYRSIIPKASECKNLFVPVCLSATHIAYGSIRMEPVFMMLGQSSGVAAAMAIDAKKDVQSVDVAKLQQQLKTNPLSDGSAAEFVVDNDDKGLIQVKGDVQTQTKGAYGATVFALASGKEQSVRFTPEITKKGKYDLYVYYAKLQGLSSQTSINVFDGKATKEVVIKQADVTINGQTSGEWLPIGSYDLPQGKKSYAEITTKGADGTVFADAFIWLPAK